MVGFLFGSALSAAILAGWPIYLHLRRRRRMRIQSVPSLRLFGYTTRKTKRIRFQQLALLIARVLFILMIAALLAQPFVSVVRYLPLPPVSGEKRDDLVLAVVLDDGLSSMHGSDDGTRLEVSKSRLRQIIRRLPTNCSISVTLTSSPFAGPLMKKDEALEYLQTLSSIPRPGQGVEAVRQAVTAFVGKQTCLLISAPRAEDLWHSAENAFNRAENVTVFLHDVSSIQTAAVIDKAGDGLVSLRGKPENLLGRTMVASGLDGIAFSHEVTAHEALIGEVAIPPLEEGRYLSVTLGDGRHPWQTYHYKPGSAVRKSIRVAVLRRQDAEGAVADKVITGILLSSGAAVSIDHVDPTQEPLTDKADAVVTVAGLHRLPGVKAWLDESNPRPATVLALPGMSSTDEWSKRAGKEAPVGPTTIVRPEGLPLDELALMEVRSMQPMQIFEPTVGTSVITLGENSPLLTKEDRGNGQLIWRLGFRAHTSEPAVFHPAFPVLIASLALPLGTDSESVEAKVGEVVRVDQWFGSSGLYGSIETPTGGTIPVSPGTADATFVPINSPGIYRFDTAEGSHYRTANMPRDLSESDLEMVDWKAKLGNPEVILVGQKQTISPDDFRPIQATTDDAHAPRKRRDLSPIAFALALAFLCIEAVILHVVWRRRASVSD